MLKQGSFDHIALFVAKQRDGLFLNILLYASQALPPFDYYYDVYIVKTTIF